MALPDFLDFPANPTLSQKYPQPPVVGVPVYTWDGEKWTTLGGTVGSTGGADDLPLMDGVASAGIGLEWSREDHVHPSDTSRLATDTRTNISLGGVASFDITVPATAKQARLTGVLYNAASATARVQISVEPGVFITTSPSTYIVNGFGYNSLAAGDVIPRTSVAETGLLLHGPPSADNLAQPVQFDAAIMLTRPDTSRVFNCESRCGYFSGFDNWHWFLTTYLIASAGGASLQVLALRILSTSTWSTGSYVTVEWLGQ